MVNEKDMEVIDVNDAVVEPTGQYPSEPIEITDSSFEDETKKYPLMVVDCWAAWCGPCRMIGPVVEELAQEYQGKIVFGKLNVDENRETSQKFGIMSIPTLLVMKDGQEIDRLIGAAPKEYLEAELKKYLS
jgi:thioredoxin 1